MSEIEEKAKSQGWNPDFEGPGAKTAEEFVRDGERIAAISSKNNKKLSEEIAGLKTTIETQNTNFSDFQKQQFKAIHEASKTGYDKAVKEIEEKQLAAVEDGDTDKYKELDKEKKDLKKPVVTTPKAEEKPKVDPEFLTWHKDNSWYKATNPDDVSMAADTYATALGKQQPGLVGADFYKAVEKHIKTVFPDKFSNQQSNLDTSEHSTQKKSGGKKYSDLPAELKKSCDLQCERMGLKREDWVKAYNKSME